MRLKKIVIEALQARGFSQAETEQIVRRLVNMQTLVNTQTIVKSFHPYRKNVENYKDIEIDVFV